MRLPSRLREATAKHGNERVRKFLLVIRLRGFADRRDGIAKQEDGHAAANHKVWNTDTAEMVTSFVQKSAQGWNLQYTYDEKYCARAVTNLIDFYEPENMKTGEVSVGGGEEVGLITDYGAASSLERATCRGGH